MKIARGSELSDRRKLAADAKASLIERYRAAMASNDPERAAKAADRQAISAARDERRAERERLKAEEKQEKQRLLQEAAERERAAEAEVLRAEQERKAADASRIAKVVEDHTARKMERDRRHADRKSLRGWDSLKAIPLVSKSPS